MDCAFSVRYAFHREVALNFFQPGEALESIADASVLGGFGGGVEFDNGGKGQVIHDVCVGEEIGDIVCVNWGEAR